MRLSRAWIHALGSLVCASSAFALTPAKPAPDPWYSLWVQIDAKSLPQGVDFRRDARQGVDRASFVNSGATPFYLVVPRKWPPELPATFIPESMAASGAAFRLDTITNEWTQSGFSGIEAGDYLKGPAGAPRQMLDMNAYLGKKKIVVRGRYVRGDRANRLVLDAPLPSPLRLVEGSWNFLIVNDGPVPLYAGVSLARPAPALAEVPSGFLARYKLLSGKAYFAAVGGWDEAHEYDAILSAKNIASHVPGVEITQVRRDDRPGNARAPEPQPFEMTAFHGKQKVTVRGRLLYDLNPDYDARALRDWPNRSRPESAVRPTKHAPTY